MTHHASALLERHARAPRARRIAFVLLLLPAMAHVPVHAEYIPDASYRLEARTEFSSLAFGPGETDIHIDALPGTVAVDDAIHFLRPDEDPTDGFNAELRIDLERLAHAETFGGQRPEAIATAEARILATNVGFTAGASALAVIQYFVQVSRREDAGLVWQPALVPTHFNARAETSGPASASVSLREASARGLLFSDGASSFPGATRHAFDRTVALDLVPGTLLQVTLSAGAHASVTSLGGPTSSFGRALADPTFTFDQHAFDLYALSVGETTFKLEDHYRFEFSPSIEATRGINVPAPPVLPWALAVLLLLPRIRRRRTPGGGHGRRCSPFLMLLSAIAANVQLPAWAAPLPPARYSAAVAFNDPLSAIGPDTFAARHGALPQEAVLDESIRINEPDDQPDDGVDTERRLDMLRVGHAETSAGARPEAVATAEVHVRDTNLGFIASAQSTASILYFVQVSTREDAGLVWRPAEVPVNFRAIASTTGPASASVELRYAGASDFLFIDSASSFPGADRHAFDRSVALSIAPDSLLQVGLVANVSAVANTQAGTFSSAGHALADPTFRFDQRAFDLYALSVGETTFKLEDHYRFEFSPSITAADPAPVSAPVGMLGAGLMVMVLGVLRRR
jgi:hypothetical protein